MQFDLEEVVFLAGNAQRIQRAWRRRKAKRGLAWVIKWHRHHMDRDRRGPWAACTIQRLYRTHRLVRKANCAIGWAVRWHRQHALRKQAALSLQCIYRGERERRDIIRPKQLARRALLEKRQARARAERNWAVIAAREARFGALAAVLVKDLAAGTDDFLHGEELGGVAGGEGGRSASENMRMHMSTHACSESRVNREP